MIVKMQVTEKMDHNMFSKILQASAGWINNFMCGGFVFGSRYGFLKEQRSAEPKPKQEKAVNEIQSEFLSLGGGDGECVWDQICKGEAWKRTDRPGELGGRK